MCLEFAYSINNTKMCSFHESYIRKNKIKSYKTNKTSISIDSTNNEYHHVRDMIMYLLHFENTDQ